MRDYMDVIFEIVCAFAFVGIVITLLIALLTLACGV